MTGIVGKTKSGNAIYSVTCKVCSQDPELFPDHFTSTKSCLKLGQKPCGCAYRPRWTKVQYMVLANRVAENRFTIHGFIGKYNKSKTKLKCECPSGHKWVSRIDCIITKKTGCPECHKRAQATPEKTAINKCIEICKDMNYNFVGFIGGKYSGSHKTRVEYICPDHGVQEVSYVGFVNSGRRCGKCYKEKQKLNGSRNGWYPERSEEQDFLYILNFNNLYIKVGRSFNVDDRIKYLKYESGVKIINKIGIYTATHKEIYDLEQNLHKNLRILGFEHRESTWSTETFENECLAELDKMLDYSNFRKVL